MLFDRNIEPRCGYCRHGSVLGFDEIACVKHGIMEAGGFCTAFKYEPTKRAPQERRASVTGLFGGEMGE